MENTAHQLSAHSASSMAQNPCKRTWQLVFWAVASRRGDDRSSTASKRGAKKKEDPIATYVEFSCSNRFSEFSAEVELYCAFAIYKVTYFLVPESTEGFQLVMFFISPTHKRTEACPGVGL